MRNVTRSLKCMAATTILVLVLIAPWLLPATCSAFAQSGPAPSAQSGSQTPGSQSKGGPIEKLLQDGWEIAGYLRAWENRTLILFKHRDHRYLVQCSVLIDVTRNPRVVPVCYDLR